MNVRQDTNTLHNGNVSRYVRQNRSVGINPLCDKLRVQYGPRIDSAVNRSVIREQELLREAHRNGWSRPRRPAPNYRVRPALRSPAPAVPEPGVKIYTPATRLPQTATAGAAAVNAAPSGAGRAPNRAPSGRRGVTAMTHSGSAPVGRTTLEALGDLITGKSLGRTDEKTVKKNDFPIGTIFALVICALLFMLVVYCSMQKSVAQSDVASLEGQVAKLEKTARDLSLSLELKDDLREIEEIATKQIGMVKKENVQTKYVSAGGEEKQLILTDGAETSGGLSAILSVFGSKLSEIMEYIN